MTVQTLDPQTTADYWQHYMRVLAAPREERRSKSANRVSVRHRYR